VEVRLGANGEWEQGQCPFDESLWWARVHREYYEAAFTLASTLCRPIAWMPPQESKSGKKVLLDPDAGRTQLGADLLFAHRLRRQGLHCYSGGNATFFVWTPDTGAIRWPLSVSLKTCAGEALKFGGGSPWTSGAIVNSATSSTT